MIPRLCFVVPCYNDEDTLAQMTTILTNKISQLAGKGLVRRDSGILFVDDGSSDSTWSLIRHAADNSAVIKGISLRKNRGQQVALYAGIHEIAEHCDVVITMDSDGQHDIDAVDKMLAEFLNGSDIVSGVRADRKLESPSKRIMVQAYYCLLKLNGISVLRNHADYRLMSKRAIELYDTVPKETFYLRGTFPFLPLSRAVVKFNYKERLSGKTHYTPGRLVRLGIDGLICQGPKPIKRLCLAGTALIITGAVGTWVMNESKPVLGKALSIIPFTAGGGLLYLAGYSLARYLEKDKMKYEITHTAPKDSYE